MKTLKNILIVIGVLAVALFITLLVLGIKIAASIFSYVLGIMLVLLAIGGIIYLVAKARNGFRKDEQ